MQLDDLRTLCFACIFLVLVTLVTVSSQPVDILKDDADSHMDTVQTTIPWRASMELYGDASNFIKRWFRRISARINFSRVQSQQTRLKRAAQQSHGKTESPDIQVDAKESNESSFEFYEKKYLINQTLNYLKQIYYYSQYRQKMREQTSATPGDSSSTQVPVIPSPIENPDETNRVNALLDSKMNELSALSMTQLENIFHNVRRAAKNGIEDPGITSLCCPQG